MTTNTIETTTSETTEVEVTTVSPYGAAKVVNQWFIDANIDKVLPPQMFYNYTTARVRKGKAPYIPITEGRIEVKDLEEWFAKYNAKNHKVEVADTESE